MIIHCRPRKYRGNRHRTDITRILQDLCRQDYLLSDSKGHWTSYHLNTLFAQKVNEKVNEGLRDTYGAILQQPGIKAEAIVRAVGKGLSTVHRYIAQLKQEEKIAFVGAAKTGGYYPIDVKASKIEQK